MNIISSTIWPSDMPDDRRVIALLGLVQISEEGMDNKTVDGIDFDLSCASSEIERLNALVAMQAETLNVMYESPTLTSLNKVIMQRVLSATAETVSAWQSKRDTEILAKALEDAAKKFRTTWNGDSDTYADAEANNEAANCLTDMASELRAKGE